MTQPTTAGVGRPSAECLRNVQLSCQLLQRQESRFVDTFFDKVLEDVRWAREAGPEQARPLCDGLARSVLWAGLSQDSDDLIAKAMRDVGARYRQQGVPDEWYREFGKALLFAVRQMQPGEWGSLLSSDWVAYYMWLSEYIRLGALEARLGQGRQAAQTAYAGQSGYAEQAGYAGQTGYSASASADFGLGAGTGTGPEPGIQSLGDVVHLLRTRYFPDNERDLATICTRVALRTGTDLRNPRPDQDTDPVAVSNVLSTLLVLGYSLQTFSIDAASEPEPDWDDAGDPGHRGTAGGGTVAGRTRALRRRVSRIFGLGRGTLGGGR